MVVENLFQAINQAASTIVAATGFEPLLFFLISAVVAAIILLLDLQDDIGVSLSLPGNKRLGFAAALLTFGALTSYIAGNGIVSLLETFRADIIGFGIIGSILLGFYYRKL